MQAISSDPFLLAGDDRGVLLVHGFTGSPFEMRVLGERLAARGMTIACPVLSGHASGSPHDLDRTRWSDWLATTEAELAALRARCRRVAVVGLSMGGLLALTLARHRPCDVDALATLGTPLWLPAYARLGAPVIARAAGRWPALALIPRFGQGSDIRDPTMRNLKQAMPAFPVNAVMSLLELCRLVRSQIEQVRAPAFLAHGAHDRTVSPACLDELARRLGSSDKHVVRLSRSGHVLTLDFEREQLSEQLGEFLVKRLA
ncbi:MAG: alpha/beta hydrolase [Kofleriaceae bacterium]